MKWSRMKKMEKKTQRKKWDEIITCVYKCTEVYKVQSLFFYLALFMAPENFSSI